MAYETGTATGPADLIAKLTTFATAQGWTISSDTTAPASGNYPSDIFSKTGRVFSKGGLVFGVGWSANAVFIIGATEVNGATNWAKQTGSSIADGLPTMYYAMTNDMAGPFLAYHFFAGSAPDFLHVVVEKTAGVFKHFQFGELKKHGTYTGGAYFCGMRWFVDTFGGAGIYIANKPDENFHLVPFDGGANAGSAYLGNCVRADIDGKTNNWMFIGTNGGVAQNKAIGMVRGVGTSLAETLHERSPSEFNQITPFVPILVVVERPSGLYSPAGYAPDLRYVNVSNFTPGETVTIGGVDWMIFPLIQKTASWGSGSSQVPSSGTYGLAYKKA